MKNAWTIFASIIVLTLSLLCVSASASGGTEKEPDKTATGTIGKITDAAGQPGIAGQFQLSNPPDPALTLMLPDSKKNATFTRDLKKFKEEKTKVKVTYKKKGSGWELISIEKAR